MHICWRNNNQKFFLPSSNLTLSIWAETVNTVWLVPWLRWQEQKLGASTHIYRVEGFSPDAGDPFIIKKRYSSGKSHICEGKSWGRKNDDFKQKPKLEPPDCLSAQTYALTTVKWCQSGVKEEQRLAACSVAQGITPWLSQGRALHGGTWGRLGHCVFWNTSAWVWGQSVTSSLWEMRYSYMLDFHNNQSRYLFWIKYPKDQLQ